MPSKGSATRRWNSVPICCGCSSMVEQKPSKLSRFTAFPAFACKTRQISLQMKSMPWRCVVKGNLASLANVRFRSKPDIRLNRNLAARD